MEDETRGPAFSSGSTTLRHPTGEDRHVHRAWIIGGVILAAATAMVYLPTLSYDFLGWDDDINVVRNPTVTSRDGLAVIWRSRHGPKGYPNYPLFYTALWLQYQLWGRSPVGFHATNFVLHTVNTILVLALMRRIGLSRAAAWLTAGLFALHPMQVESVAWITELKNLLSGTFYLTAFLFYSWQWEKRGRAAGSLALIFFAAALLSKTASVTLVASLFLADYFVLVGDEGCSRASVRLSCQRLLPFAVFGIVAGVALMGAEASPAEAVPWLCRPLIAAAGLWFYAAKLIAPVGLAPIYPRWAVSPASIMWWLPLGALLVSAFGARRWRRELKGKVLWGLSHFVVTLLPALGLAPFAYNDLSFVADRFVYLASVGLFMVLALGVEAAVLKFWSKRTTAVALSAGGAAVLAGLALMTSRQLPFWRDSAELWSYAAERDPTCWMAHHNLGSALYFEGRDEDALHHWRRCVEIRPDYSPAYLKIALVLTKKGDLLGAREQLHRAVNAPPPPMAVRGLAEMLALASDRSCQPELRALIGGALAAGGCFSQGVGVLQEDIRLAPTCAEAYKELAWIRATAANAEWRNGGEAIRLAGEAIRLAGQEETMLLDVQAAAYAEAGQFSQAVATAKRAIDLAVKPSDETSTSQIQVRLTLYQRRQPYRAPFRAGLSLPAGADLPPKATALGG